MVRSTLPLLVLWSTGCISGRDRHRDGKDGALDGGDDTAQDGDADSDSDRDSDSDVDYAGAYSGTWSMDAMLVDISLSDTCTGTLTVDVTGAGSDNLSGDGPCTWQGLFSDFIDSGVAVEADLDPHTGAVSDGTASANVLDIMMDIPMYAAVGATGPTIDGGFSDVQTVDLDGMAVSLSVEGTFSVRASVPVSAIASNRGEGCRSQNSTRHR